MINKYKTIMDIADIGFPDDTEAKKKFWEDNAELQKQVKEQIKNSQGEQSGHKITALKSEHADPSFRGKLEHPKPTSATDDESFVKKILTAGGQKIAKFKEAFTTPSPEERKAHLIKIGAIKPEGIPDRIVRFVKENPELSAATAAGLAAGVGGLAAVRKMRKTKEHRTRK